MRSSTRHLASSWVALVALVGITGLAGVASAQSAEAPAAEVGTGGYPLANALRPLTMPAGLLRVDAGLGFASLCFSGLSRRCPTAVALNVGAGYGITDDLEVGAYVVPLLLMPDFAYGDPSIYGQYRFVTGDIEVGVRGNISLPVRGRFHAEVGAPIWLKLSPTVALRTGGWLTLVDTTTATSAHALGVGLSAPFLAVIHATESLWFGIESGVAFSFTNPGPGDTFVMPLGFQVGYAVPGATGAPIVDVVGSLAFPAFLWPAGPDVIATNFWTIGIGARIYIDTQS